MRHAMSAGTVLALSLAVSPAAAAVITGTGGDDLPTDDEITKLSDTPGDDVLVGCERVTEAR